MPARPEADTPRFLAWLYSTPAQQPVFGALCGIEREIGESLRPGVDHNVAHTRLEWWREECARCAAGKPVHPLTRELRAHLEESSRREQPAHPEPSSPGDGVNSALTGLSGLVDVATWDLANATFERREELTAYCRRWAAAIVAPLAAPLEADWTGPGAALRELELLGELTGNARAGRLRVPLDELAQAGVSPEALARSPWPQALMDLVRARHQVLRGQLATAVAGVPPQSQHNARGLLVWTALACQASRRAERALPNASAPSIASAAAANWLAWRAARAAARGRLRLRPG